MDLYSKLKNVEVGRPLWDHWAPLVNYLALTCFDVLGQSGDWLSFDSWLSASDKEDERTSALSSAGEQSDPVASARLLAGYHARQYGVLSSFRRFVHTVLNEQQRRSLLDSIRIETIRTPPLLGGHELGTDRDKEDYLFQIRHRYTHSADGVSGVHTDLYPWPPNHEAAWKAREQWIDANSFSTASVRGWPDVLESTVLDGLAAVLRSLSSEVAK
jgi:hypothetical protein